MRFLFLPYLCMLVCASTVLAQPQRTDRSPATEEELLEEGDAPRYQLALGYLQGMQFDQAIAILRDLYREYPERPIFFEKLKEAYVSAKQYANAIALLEDELAHASTQREPVLAAERAQLLYLSGNEPAAMDAWHALVDSSSWAENAYLIAYNSMLRVRLLVQAIDLLLRGRNMTGSQDLFQTELAYLYNLTGQHELATQEYLDLLARNERQLNYVKGRFARDLQQEGALDAATRVTKLRTSVEPELLQFRDLLAWLYEENGEFGPAYEEMTALAKRRDVWGHEMYQFALRAAEEGAFGVAAKAFQDVLTTHPEENISAEVHLGIADMHRLQAERTSPSPEHYTDALEAYERFLTDYPEHPQIPLVMARIASLQQDVFRDGEAARDLLSVLSVQYANSPVGHQAQFDLGRLAVEEGNLDEAMDILVSLSERTEGELSVQSRFEQALIHFYSGRFEETQSILAGIQRHTDKETANNAIMLRVLLLENPPSDSTNQALRRYARAQLLLRQQKAKETVQAAQDILAQWGQHPIADETRFLRAEALLLDRQMEEAQAAFGEFSLIHPTSPLRDRSLFHYAEILETRGTPAEALQAYNDLLVQHPGSLLVSKVRERIRVLRATNL